MKKKTPTQKYIDQAVQLAVDSVRPHTNIQDTHVEMNLTCDASIEKLADALVQQAKAVQDLAKLIKPQSICAIKVEQAHKDR